MAGNTYLSYILYLGFFRSWQCNPGKWRFDIMMVRNEWHPLVRGTFKQISQVALKMKPFETGRHQAMTLNCTGRILHCTSDLVSWGQWGGRGKIGMKVVWMMWHVTIDGSSPDFSLNLSPFVRVPHGGTRQFWWLLLPKKSFLERSAPAKKDSAELVAFHQVDGFFMFFCSIFLLYFDESFQGLTGLL